MEEEKTLTEDIPTIETPTAKTVPDSEALEKEERDPAEIEDNSVTE